jgi:hypothetical protein
MGVENLTDGALVQRRRRIGLQVLLEHPPEVKSVNGKGNGRRKMTRPAEERPEEELPIIQPLFS